MPAIAPQTDHVDPLMNMGCDMNTIYYFGRLVIAIQLRRSHGTIFAAAFLAEFDVEISRAIDIMSQRTATRH